MNVDNVPIVFDIKPEYFDAYDAVSSGTFKENALVITYEVKEDMGDVVKRRVLITDSASWSIPELNLEVEAGTAHFAPLEKLVDQVRENTKAYLGDRFTNEALFVDLVKGKLPFTLIIEDPLGNSHILVEENEKTSNVLTMDWMRRTPQQDEEYNIQSRYNVLSGDKGFAQMKQWLGGEKKKIVLLTGAGCSTESNLPSYRGNIKDHPEAIWKTFDTKICTYDNIVNDPSIRKQYWHMEKHFMKYLKNAKPNPAHTLVAALHKKGLLHQLVTQNIDDLYDAAGVPPESIIKIHGSLGSVSCLSCHKTHEGGIHDCIHQYESEKDPSCSHCGGILKPDTIAFGQPLRQKDLDKAFESLNDADLFIIMGTSLKVAPINTMASLALQKHVPMVLINLGEHDYKHVANVYLEGKAGEVSSKLMDFVTS